MQLKAFSLAFALLGAVAYASASELVTNGDFETKDADGIFGAGWTVNANFDYGNDRSYFFDEWGDISGYFSGASANITYLYGDDVSISQSIQTTGYTGAKLSFSFYSDAYDPISTGDLFKVYFGGVQIDSFNTGDDGSGAYVKTLTYDLTPYFTGGLKTLELRGINQDDGTNGGVGTYVDNVSITATPVPEPASMVALGLGAAAMIRRRAKR